MRASRRTVRNRPYVSTAAVLASLRQGGECFKISAHVGFLLRPRPPLDPALGGDRVGDPLIRPVEDQLYGTASEGVATRNQPLGMFTRSLLDGAQGDPGVVPLAMRRNSPCPDCAAWR
jgi:hypothetical protein